MHTGGRIADPAAQWGDAMAKQPRKAHGLNWTRGKDGTKRPELVLLDPEEGGPMGHKVGPKHAERVHARKRPTDKSIWLMKLCVRAARHGGWKDTRIAQVVAEASGIPLTGAMIAQWKRSWPRFREQMAAAQEEVLDSIEADFVRRALTADDAQAYKYGIAMLKSRRAEFREKVEVNQTVQANVQHLHVIARMSPAEVQASLERHGRSLRTLDAVGAAEGSGLPAGRLGLGTGSGADD